MRKTMRRLFAILMTLAIVITAIPMMEVKAEETKEVMLTYYWYDVNEGASYHRETIIIEDDMTYGEFEELYLPTPETDENFSFLGWESDYNSDNVVADGARLYYDAIYDKYPVDIVKVYVDGNNSVIVQEFKNYYESGTTFAEILPEYTEIPDDMGTQYEFTKWNTSIYPAEEVNMNKTYCEIFADYTDHNIVKLSYEYVQDNGEYGVPILDSQYVIVEKDIALCGKEDTILQKYFEENCAPTDHYTALGFTEWKWWNGDNWDAEEINDNEWAFWVSVYSKGQIVLEAEDESQVYAANPGETLELPTELNGNKVSWECDWDDAIYTDSYTIPEDVVSDDVITLTAIVEEANKKEIEILREVYDQENGWQSLFETYTVSENATIEEIMEILPDAEDLENCKFTGWNYTGNLEGVIPTFRATYEKNIITVYLEKLSNDGNAYYESKALFLVKDAIYGDILDLLVDADDVMGCSFVEWKLVNDQISLDEVIVETYVYVEAVYDKYPVHIQKIHADQDGSVKCDKLVEIYDAGTSMSDVYDVHKTLPTDATEWYAEYNHDGIISTSNNEIILTAQYEDVVIVEYDYQYIEQQDKYGMYQIGTHFVVLDKGVCQNEDKVKEHFEETIVNNLNLVHYDELRFMEWDYWNVRDSNEDGTFDYVDVSAIYNENEKIILHVRTENPNPYVYVAYAGEVIQLPTEIEGYYYTWYEGGTNREKVIEDGTYTVPADAFAGEFFMVEAVKGDKILEQVTPPADTNTNPGNNVPPPADTNTNPGNNVPPPADTNTNPGNDVPTTADTTSAIPYVTLLLFGAGVFVVGCKRRNFVR